MFNFVQGEWDQFLSKFMRISSKCSFCIIFMENGAKPSGGIWRWSSRDPFGHLVVARNGTELARDRNQVIKACFGMGRIYEKGNSLSRKSHHKNYRLPLKRLYGGRILENHKFRRKSSFRSNPANHEVNLTSTPTNPGLEWFWCSTITDGNHELQLNSWESYRNIFDGMKTEDL